MVCDSSLVLPHPARPGSFGGLMALYESNYIRLRWLLPDLQRIRHAGTRLMSRTDADFPLYLDVLEAVRYTTTLRLTYFLDSEEGLLPDPDLRLRIYHDAGQLETMDCTAATRHEVLKPFRLAEGSPLRRKWNRNMMLHKWLEYCADRGHDFSTSVKSCWLAGSRTDETRSGHGGRPWTGASGMG